MSAGVVTRVLPPAVFGVRRARYIVERNAMVYRRAWMMILGGVVEPILYLFAIGVGLSRLVDHVHIAGSTIGYAEFVAPALLAASAMNGAVQESTMNIFMKIRFAGTYNAMLATPVRPFDIAVGEITWSQVRGLLYAVSFLAVLGVLGLLDNPVTALLALPGAMLVGFAFGAVGMAASTFMTSWQHISMVQLVVLPMFLFSATFYPAEIYPEAVRWLVQLSPLYHGVALLRALTLGTVGVATWGHVAFLLAMVVVGMSVAGRRIEKLLLS